MARVKVYLTKRLVKVFELSEPVVTIGRAPENKIQILDKSVSRRHAHIIMEEGKPVLEDLGSANGTKVNGVRVNRAVLKDGDALSVGTVKMVLYEAEAPSVAPDHIFTVSRAPISADTLKKMLSLKELGLVLPTERNVIDACYEVAREFIEKSGLSQEDSLNLQTAVYEAIDNARRHGNVDDPNKMIRLFLRAEKDSVSATVTDEGDGFDFVSVLRKTGQQDAVSAARDRYMSGGMGGLGIRLMLKCVDRLEYDNKGSKITLTKMRREAAMLTALEVEDIVSVVEEEEEFTEREKAYRDELVQRIKARHEDMNSALEEYKEQVSRVMMDTSEPRKEPAAESVESAESAESGDRGSDTRFLHSNLPDEFGFENNDDLPDIDDDEE